MFIKRNKQLFILLFTGTLLLLCTVLPIGIRSPQSNLGDGNYKITNPRVASDYGYLFTIGSTTSGSDNDHFKYPFGVAVNASGYVYVVDQSNQRVQVFNCAGIYQYTIGIGWGTGNYQFMNPWGAAINGSGCLFVADMTNDRIQVFDTIGIYQFTIGDEGGTGNYLFNNPTGVAVNQTGHIYVADSGYHRVGVYDKAGIFLYNITGSGVNQLGPCYGVAVNSTGHVFVADQDNCSVRVFDNAGNFQHTICGSSGSGNYQLLVPQGVAVNGSDYLFVADTWNHRVQVFNPGGIYQYTICGNGGGSANNQFRFPRSVAVNSTGGIYVADAYNNRTQVFILPPSELTVQINSGAADTATLAVTLTLSAKGGTEMCFSNNGTTFTDWEDFSTSKSWIFEGGLGSKIVYFKVRNPAVESGPVYNVICYTLPPTGLVISINGGATETKTPSVSLTLTAMGATQMCFSNDGVTWSPWEPFADSKIWTLAEGAGSKTVFFKTRNGTIEAQSLATDTISFSPADNDWWVLPAIIAIIVGIIVAITAYTRGHHKKVERFWATSIAKLTDVMNIQYLLVIHKETGTAILSQNMRSHKLDGDLISGFLTALTSFQSELAAEKLDPAGKKGFALDYEKFKIFLEDGVFIRAALILGAEASATLKEKLVNYITQYEKHFYNELKDWRGNLKTVEGGPNLIEQIFDLQLIHPYIPNLKVDKKELSTIVRFLYELALNIAKVKPPLLLTDLLEQASVKRKESKNHLWTVIYEMIEKHILEPASIEKKAS